MTSTLKSTGMYAQGFSKLIAGGGTYSFPVTFNKPCLIAFSRADSNKKGLVMFDGWHSIVELVAPTGATISLDNNVITIVNSNVSSGAIALLVFNFDYVSTLP